MQLQAKRDELLIRRERNPIANEEFAKRAATDEGKKWWQTTVEEVLKPATDKLRLDKAKYLLNHDTQLNVVVDSMAEKVKDQFDLLFREVEAGLKGLLSRASTDEAEQTVCKVLNYYNFRYDLYDWVSFPIVFGTDVKSLEEIAVHRISPQDAVSLIDELNDPRHRRKLAGTSLFAFGAFFERKWRENDMMWGRLDAAERLVNMLLPGNDANCLAARNQLVRRAQDCIPKETIVRTGGEEIMKLLSSELGKQEVPESVRGALANPKLLSAVIASFLSEDAMRQYLTEAYEVDRRYPPQATLPIAARAIRVFGRVLETVSNERKTATALTPRIVTATRVFWLVVEAAVPDGTAFLSVRYLFGVLILVEVFAAVASIFIKEIRVAVLEIMVTTIAAWIGWFSLHQIMRGRPPVIAKLVAGLIGTVGFLFLLGTLDVLWRAPAVWTAVAHAIDFQREPTYLLPYCP
jgi:hypothetical protein